MNRVFLTLGSNIDKELNMRQAVRMLRERVAVKQVSAVFETAPMGTEDQPCFFNAAVLIETELTPEAIKDNVIADIEMALKRRRQADKNAPRTIDIDIALFNDAVLDYVPADGRPRHIPDPDLLRSLHTVAPLADLAPDQPHPETGEPLQAIAARLQNEADRPVIWLRDDFELAS